MGAGAALPILTILSIALTLAFFVLVRRRRAQENDDDDAPDDETS